MTTENTVNYVLKVLAPVLEGKASEVEVKPFAEREYVTRVQAASKATVLSKCNSVRFFFFFAIFFLAEMGVWILSGMLPRMAGTALHTHGPRSIIGGTRFPR